MAKPNEDKLRAMDSINNPQIRSMIRIFRKNASPPMTPATTGLLGGKLTKLDEMNAMVKATTITAKGLSRATGGVALYVAHIRQMDREQQRGVTPTHSSKRDIERG